MGMPDKVILSHDCSLKLLESPSAYNIKTGELYTLDREAYNFLASCRTPRAVNGIDPEFIDYCMSEGLLAEGGTEGGIEGGAQGGTGGGIEGGANTYKRLVQEEVSPTPSLRYLEVLLTEKCNLRCRHCYLDEPGKGELSVDRVYRVLKEFESIGGLKVMLSGGEPMLHTRFWEINSILAEFSLRTALLTNGMFIDKHAAESLNVHEVQVSIDGLERSHDSLRGDGTFKKAIEALKAARDAGKDTAVATMVHRENRDDFPGMMELFTRIGVKQWSIDVPCPAGRLEDNEGLLLPHSEASRLLSFGFGEASHSSSPGYACGSHLMCVTSRGNFARCGFFREDPLNTIEEGLKGAWNRLHHWRLDELGCDCPHKEECKGGCRYRAYLKYGTFKAPDPVMCGAYGVEIEMMQSHCCPINVG